MAVITVCFFFLMSLLCVSADGGERAALLQLKQQLSDPAGILSGWDPAAAAAAHCAWPFISCDARGGRVTAINITRRPRSHPLAGHLSAAIGGLAQLRFLSLPSHALHGQIPPSLSRCLRLETLDLSGNMLRGTIPRGFAALKRLRYLSLADNNLTGQIPAGLARLLSLQVLDLSSNRLTGEIPPALLKLGSLSVLLLSNNNLSGQAVPSAFANVTVNTSFNCHSSIPFSYLIKGRRLGDTLSSSSYIDYPSPPRPPSTENKSNGGFSSIEIASVATAAAIVAVLLVLIVIYVYTRKCVPSSSVRSSERREVTVFVDIGVPLTYETVVRAAGNFNASNCIGSGGFGATYKAEISPGVIVAIKRLAVGRCQGVQQFHAEIRILGRWRHPNLVTLIGYHVSDAEMFLIYNYLPGGNLERFLHERSRRAADQWTMLYKIALDVAQALAYLHDHCVPRILHRDVKPSNILLDNEFNAYLSDFGLARILGNSETHATTGVAGTFGYVAPEYAMTSRVSDKADVYSYGVVLLELLSDKKALDPSFSPYGNGFNIVAWASMLLEESRAEEFFADGLWLADSNQNLIETLKLAVRCTEEQLYRRPSMKHVVRRLKELQPPACYNL